MLFPSNHITNGTEDVHNIYLPALSMFWTELFTGELQSEETSLQAIDLKIFDWFLRATNQSVIEHTRLGGQGRCLNS